MADREMSRKTRLTTTGLMALIMCGIMSFLVTVINRGIHLTMISPWLRNWIIAIIALYPVSYFVTPFISGLLRRRAGMKGIPFHLLRAVILGVVYAFWMTFVMAVVNVGFTAGFLKAWMRSFKILAGIAAVLLYFLIPPVQRLAGRICAAKKNPGSGEREN